MQKKTDNKLVINGTHYEFVRAKKGEDKGNGLCEKCAISHCLQTCGYICTFFSENIKNHPDGYFECGLDNLLK